MLRFDAETITTGRAVLAGFRDARTASKASAETRVAEKYVRTALHASYDLMVRLQILEGAAGVPLGSWWRKARISQGITEAFAGAALDPSWLSPQDTGAAGLAVGLLGQSIRSFNFGGAPPEPLGMLNAVLMGVSTIDNEHVSEKPVFYHAGTQLRAGILNGSEDPKAIVGGPANKWIKRKVLNDWRKWERDRGESLDTHEDSRETAEERVEDTGPSVTLSQIILGAFLDRSSPLGKKLRQKFRMAWRGTPREDSMGRLWLGYIEQHGTFPDQQDIAKQVGPNPKGISAQAFGKNHLRKGMVEALKAVWSDKSLVKLLELFAIRSGYQPDFSPPSAEEFENLMKGRTRRASPEALVERVAQRFLDS